LTDRASTALFTEYVPEKPKNEKVEIEKAAKLG